MTITLVKQPAIYIAGTINRWNDDPDIMVRAENNENGPEQEHGWISPSWSMWTVHDRRKDAGPAEVFDPEDVDPDDPSTSMPCWLARKIEWHIGAIDSVSGNVFYAADAYTDLRHDENSDTNDDISLSAVVEHVTPGIIEEVANILESRQMTKIERT